MAFETLLIFERVDEDAGILCTRVSQPLPTPQSVSAELNTTGANIEGNSNHKPKHKHTLTKRSRAHTHREAQREKEYILE